MDFGSLKKWADRNFTTFKKSKHKALHLRWNKLMQWYRLRLTGKQLFWKGPGNLGGEEVETAMWCCGWENQQQPECCISKICRQQIQRVDPSFCICHLWDCTWDSMPSLGISNKRETWTYWIESWGGQQASLELRHMTYEERHWVMDLLSLEKRNLGGNLQLNVVSATSWSEDIKETEPDYSWRCTATGWEKEEHLDTIWGFFYYEVVSVLEEIQRH